MALGLCVFNAFWQIISHAKDDDGTRERREKKNLSGDYPHQLPLPIKWNQKKVKNLKLTTDMDYTNTNSGARSRSYWIPPLFRGWEQHDGTQVQSEYQHWILTMTNWGLDKRKVWLIAIKDMKNSRLTSCRQ